MSNGRETKGYYIPPSEFFARQEIDSFGAFSRAQDALAQAEKRRDGYVYIPVESDAPMQEEACSLLPIVTLRDRRSGIPELNPLDDEPAFIERLIKNAGGEVRRDGAVISPLNQIGEQAYELIQNARTVGNDRSMAADLGIRFTMLTSTRSGTGPYRDYVIHDSRLSILYGVASTATETGNIKSVLNMEIMNKRDFDRTYSENSKRKSGYKR